MGILDVVVTRSTDWSTIIIVIVGLVGALSGALIGAVTIVIMEAWRRVLDAISSSRLIRMEMYRITTTIRTILDGHTIGIPLVSSNWNDKITALAPLLREVQLARMFKEFALLPELQQQVDLGRAAPARLTASLRLSLEKSYKGLHDLQEMLESVEAKSPMSYVRQVLLGRHQRTDEDTYEFLKDLAS